MLGFRGPAKQDDFVKLVEITMRKEEAVKAKVKGAFVSEDHMRDILKLKESFG